MNGMKKFYLGFFCLILFIVGIVWYYPIYKAESDPYRYWNELIAKNRKPENVSQAEFVAKNKEGYCWRDEKYYSEKELKDKAMVHFSETFLHYIKLAKEEKLVRDGGDIVGESAFYCKKSDAGCRLWFVPTDKTNQDFKNILLNDYRDSPHYIKFLQKLNSKEVPNPKTLADYMTSHDKYAIFHNGFEEQYIILGSDCCSILKEEDIKKISKSITYGADNYSQQSEIPADIQDVTEYGIGVYYLSVDHFSYRIAQENYYAEREQDRYRAYFDDRRRFYFLSNCGDVLFKPYYSKSVNTF